MGRTYTTHDLIEARIQLQQAKQVGQSDILTYVQTRYTALQTAFGIHFTMEELPATALRGIALLFQSTVDSYLARRTPFTGILEYGLGLSELYDEFHQPFDRIFDQNMLEHWKLLEHLFERWYGNVATTCTSDDLLRFGFDDCQPIPAEDC